MSSRNPLLRSALLIATCLLLAAAATATGSTDDVPTSHLRETDATKLTPLDLYVQSPDPHYSFEVVDQQRGEQNGRGFTTHIVRMTSQAWLTKEQVDRPVWDHWLVVVEPDERAHDTALLYIGGGSNDDPQPTSASPLMIGPALTTGSICAELRMVPNQPLTFEADDLGPRKEDAIIAYGWDKFLRGGARDHDALWLARLPMTKSAVRAMDTIEALFEERPVTGFTVAGGSKRGWTTWTTAAVDDRVVAIVPFVIDLLNVEASFQHHWQAYGFWAPAVYDYKREGIMEWQGRSEYTRLLEITEPFSYRERLAGIPKYLINASGDEFFLPDSWQFYWDQLPGEKHLRYVANGNHSLAGTNAPQSLIAFYSSVLGDVARPTYSWQVEGNRIVVTTPANQPPEKIELWSATNDRRRDFRVDMIKRSWAAEEISVRDDGRYEIELEEPDSGWRAGFVELTFANPAKDAFDNPLPPIQFTTGTLVVPQDLPFARYEPDVSTLPSTTGQAPAVVSSQERP